jgi:hypothetical protein
MPKVTERASTDNQSRVTRSPRVVINPISVGMGPVNPFPTRDRVAAQTIQADH